MAKANETTATATTSAQETVEERKPRYVKLADPGGSFVDPDTDFRLVGEEVKELGAGAGKLTLTWLRGGGLVDADAPLDADAQTSKKSGKK